MIRFNVYKRSYIMQTLIRSLSLCSVSGHVLAMALALMCSLAAWSGPTFAQENEAAEVPVHQVDINSADADTLALALDGVGMARAEAIVAYREEHGPFMRIEDLQQVSGIGPATLERNRERLRTGSADD